MESTPVYDQTPDNMDNVPKNENEQHLQDTKLKKSNKIVIFTIGLLIILSLFFLVFYKYYETKTTNRSRESSGEPAAPSGSISGWKTYKNESLGISFEYPPEWKPELETSFGRPRILLTGGHDSSPRERLIIETEDEISTEIMKKLHNYYKLAPPDGKAVTDAFIAGISGINISGEQTVKTTGWSKQEPDIKIYQSGITLLNEETGTVLTLTLSDNSNRDYSETFEKILNSMTIIPSPLLDIHKWESYDTANYSLRYPPGSLIIPEGEKKYYIATHEGDRCITVTENTNKTYEEVSEMKEIIEIPILDKHQSVTNLQKGSSRGLVKALEVYSVSVNYLDNEGNEYRKEDSYATSENYQLLLSFECLFDEEETSPQYRIYKRIITTIKMPDNSAQYNEFMQELDKEIAKVSSQD